jgi:hypothetical protein
VGGDGGKQDRSRGLAERRTRQAGHPGLTGAEVDEVIADVVRDREGVDQREFFPVHFSFVSSFSLVLATLGMNMAPKGLATGLPLAKESRISERRTIPVEKSGGA